MSPKERESTVEILARGGVAVQTVGPLTVAAGGVIGNFSNHENRSHCRVAVKGARSTVRVSLETRVGGSAVSAVDGL